MNLWFNFLNEIWVRKLIRGLALTEHFLQINPAFEVIRNSKLFILRFALQLVTVVVSARCEHKLCSNNFFFYQEFVHLFECILQNHTLIDLILCNAC